MKKVLIAIAIIIAILILFLNGQEAKHDNYAKENNCEWIYYANGFEVCK